MEFSVYGSRRNKKFVEAILPSVIRQLNLENSKKGVSISISDECSDVQGQTVDMSNLTGCYMVVITPRRHLVDIGITLCHEMVHVKQMAKGQLKTNDKFNIWSGKKYKKNFPYLDSPWEIEAYSRQELIFRKSLLE
jgi:hypothetical protein